MRQRDYYALRMWWDLRGLPASPAIQVGASGPSEGLVSAQEMSFEHGLCVCV